MILWRDEDERHVIRFFSVFLFRAIASISYQQPPPPPPLPWKQLELGRMMCAPSINREHPPTINTTLPPVRPYRVHGRRRAETKAHLWGRFTPSEHPEEPEAAGSIPRHSPVSSLSLSPVPSPSLLRERRLGSCVKPHAAHTARRPARTFTIKRASVEQDKLYVLYLYALLKFCTWLYCKWVDLSTLFNNVPSYFKGSVCKIQVKGIYWQNLNIKAGPLYRDWHDFYSFSDWTK